MRLILTLASCAILMFFSKLLTMAPKLFRNVSPATLTKLLRTDNQRSPVILVPGIGGSQLEAKLSENAVINPSCKKKTSGFFNIWLNLEEMKTNNIDCLINNLKLVYNNETKTTSNPVGVDIRVPGWGNSSVLEYRNPNNQSPGAFSDIANMLVNDLGYIRNLSLRGAPYDFRKGPNENEDYFLRLKDLIEETYAMNNNRSVTLLAHSIGGPMSLIFLQRQNQVWKDKYINSLITLASPWGGSARTLKVFASGENFGIPSINESKLRELLRTFPVLGWLLPSKMFWKHDEVLVETQSRNYTFADIHQYLKDINVPNGWQFYENNEKYQLDRRPPGVEFHCLHGVNVSTIVKLLYEKEKVMQDKPTFIYGEGDGTVILRSLEGCTLLNDEPHHKFYHPTFPGVSHRSILKDKNVLSYIRKALA